MFRAKNSSVLFLFIVCLTANWSSAGDTIPKAAWKRPIGQPLANAGTKKPTLEASHIDDGYWQGAPVGGFGSGTFSRDYRGNFSRWHLKGGVHKYQTIYANQFAMFQKSEGRLAEKLAMGLPGRGWRLLRTLSQVMVRLPLRQISRSCCTRAVFSCASAKLS